MSRILEKAQAILSETRCEECGVVLLGNITETQVKLGAMNPSFSAVVQLVDELKSAGLSQVTTATISAEEWEKWKDNHPAESAESPPLTGDSDSGHGPIDLGFNNYEEPTEQPIPENLPVTQPINQEENLEESIESELGIIGEEVFFADLGEEEEEEEAIGEQTFGSNSDPIISAVSTILSNCRKLKASDIHIEPQENSLRVRYRIDGILKEYYRLPKRRTRPIISRIKIISKLNIAEKRLPQDGRIRCNLNGSIEDFRVSTLPGKWGEKVVLRSLQSDPSILDLQKLVTSEKELKQIRELGQYPYGIFIVVGPTGSGKSTTLYSILSERNSPDINISTVEDPVEYTLQGIHQVQVIREKGLDFARALRSLMRQDPDVILVGETRDRETAQTAMEAALTGHMVFTTLHANDTATALTRLAEMDVPPYLVGASVVGVMAQRLVRQICPSCSTIKPTEIGRDDLAISYGIQNIRVAKTIDVNLAAAEESQACCTICSGTGYKGRLGLYEVMPITDELRELILKHATADLIRDCAKRNGMRTLLDYAMELVKQQLTTMAEVERVCMVTDASND